LRILTTPAYFQAASIIPIVLAAYYVRALGDFYRIVLLAKGLPSQDAACNWISAIVSLTAYFILIPRYGITGAAFATLITFVVAFAISYVWSCRTWRFPLESKRLMKLGVVTGGLCLVHLALPPTWNILEIVRGLLLLMAFAAALFLWRFPSPAEMDLLRSLRSRMAAYSSW
jgi:O-antigen/teichoic acid export membrane protein